MPLRLTEAQLQHYRNDGFAAPVRVFPPAEAAVYRAELEAHEATLGQPVSYPEKSKCHLLFDWADAIVHHPAVLDAVEDVIGPNILLFHFTLQTKEAHRGTVAVWHQDDAYFNLDPAEEVTAWVALSNANELSGCMRMIPGSHKAGIAVHADTSVDDSIIRRVQQVGGYAPQDGVLAPLKAGEMSLHHTHMVHSSGPNNSDDRRIGLTLSYIPTHVRPTGSIRPAALLVRGTDQYGYYQPETRLAHADPPEARLQAHRQAAGLYYDLSKTEVPELSATQVA
ncbi:phytanoyl-CoA dioxygenase family protein [Rhodopila sp.]|uniref:phytanoyl-CoA dioxygenase family protein n=1 Tax=Rhodopila sp. TaxID=2480087 RepID=UPI003D096FDD